MGISWTKSAYMNTHYFCHGIKSILSEYFLLIIRKKGFSFKRDRRKYHRGKANFQRSIYQEVVLSHSRLQRYDKYPSHGAVMREYGDSALRRDQSTNETWVSEGVKDMTLRLKAQWDRMAIGFLGKRASKTRMTWTLKSVLLSRFKIEFLIGEEGSVHLTSTAP